MFSFLQSLGSSKNEPRGPLGPVRKRPERPPDLRQLRARHIRHLHPPVHRQPGLGFAQAQGVLDRPSRDRLAVDGAAQPKHGGA